MRDSQLSTLNSQLSSHDPIAIALAEDIGPGDLTSRYFIGSFDIGKEADLTVMDYAALLPYRQSSKTVNDVSGEDLASVCIYRSGPHAVLETFVRGQSVFRAPEPELF